MQLLRILEDDRLQGTVPASFLFSIVSEVRSKTMVPIT